MPKHILCVIIIVMIIVLKGGHNMSSVSSDTQFNLDTEAVRNALRRQEMRKDLGSNI